MGKKLLGMSSSGDGFISNCRMRLDMVDVFKASWDSITKIHPLIEHDDGMFQCGKCGTGHDEEQAVECCTSCKKCGLRDHLGHERGEKCCPCTCGDCDLDEKAFDAIFEAARNNPDSKDFWDIDDPNNELGLRNEDDDVFTRSFDSIIKEPNWKVNVPYEELSPQQRAAMELSNRIFRDGIEGVMSPEIDIKEVGGEGDKCCAKLRTEAQRIYDRFKGTPAEVILQDDYAHSIEEDCETELVPAIKSSISYAEYLIDGHNKNRLDPDAKIMLEGKDPDWALRMDEVLEDLKQMILEYEACKMGGFDAKENESTGFYASADPFELAWDSISKEQEYVEIEYESGETIQLSFEEFDKIKLDWENDDDIVAVRTYRGDEVSQILKSE